MLAKYTALLRRGIGEMFQYRASMMIWMLINVMPLVMLAVWFSMSEGGPIAGYTQNDFVSYYLLMAFSQQMTSVWVIYHLGYDIRHGDLSAKLLHPLNPLHEYLSANLADKVLKPIVLLPLALAAWLIFPGAHYQVNVLSLSLFAVSIAAAWLLRFMIQYTFGLAAFWISDSTTLNDIWFALSELLGGLIAPLALFPSEVARVAIWLPFRFMLSFPVEIMTGRLNGSDLAGGFATLAFWLALSIAVYIVVWRKGVRKFGAFGA